MNSDPFDPGRRAFLARLAAAGGAGLAGLCAAPVAAEPPPETDTLRIVYDPTIPVLCYGPKFVALELLRAEGFENVEFVPYAPDWFGDANLLASAEADITAAWGVDIVIAVDRGGPVVTLAGMHTGCIEIFGSEAVSSINDLKGKRIAIYSTNSPEHLWLASMLAYVGLDPERDLEWVVTPYERWGDALTAGEVDAVMMWPPDAQSFRTRGVGRVIVNTTTDRPWRDYFCCMLAGNETFVARHPVATKRALRAMLKATDLCAAEPARAARIVVDQGFPTDYERAAQVFREIPYGQWREHDPEDALRFYALRLHETGAIRRSPEEIAARGDWRFLQELKRELKG